MSAENNSRSARSWPPFPVRTIFANRSHRDSYATGQSAPLSFQQLQDQLEVDGLVPGDGGHRRTANGPVVGAGPKVQKLQGVVGRLFFQISLVRKQGERFPEDLWGPTVGWGSEGARV